LAYSATVLFGSSDHQVKGEMFDKVHDLCGAPYLLKPKLHLSI
jgi:hypothetical protein